MGPGPNDILVRDCITVKTGMKSNLGPRVKHIRVQNQIVLGSSTEGRSVLWT